MYKAHIAERTIVLRAPYLYLINYPLKEYEVWIGRNLWENTERALLLGATDYKWKLSVCHYHDEFIHLPNSISISNKLQVHCFRCAVNIDISKSSSTLGNTWTE